MPDPESTALPHWAAPALSALEKKIGTGRAGDWLTDTGVGITILK